VLLRRLLFLTLALAAAACSLRGTDELQSGLSTTGPGSGGGGSGGNGGAPPCAGANLDEDAKNCGACGHDCLGGACAAGHCQPVMLYDVKALGVSPPTFLAAYDGSVYFGHGVALHRVRASDGEYFHVCTHASGPWFIAASERGVYFTTVDYGLMHAELLDTQVVCEDVMTADNMLMPAWVGPLALDGSGVFLGLLSEQGPLYRASFSDLEGNPSPIPFLGFTAAQYNLISIATSARGRLAFSSMVAVFNGQEIICETPGGVYRLPQPAQEQPLAQNSCALQVVTDGHDVYWTDVGAHALVWNGYDGSPATVTTLVDDQVEPLGIAMDADYVYWADAGNTGQQNGAMRRLARAGGAAEEMASGLGEPWLITSDDVALYWVDRYSEGGNNYGRIMKLAK
jgi:hypothetical protein